MALRRSPPHSTATTATSTTTFKTATAAGSLPKPASSPPSALWPPPGPRQPPPPVSHQHTRRRQHRSHVEGEIKQEIRQPPSASAEPGPGYLEAWSHRRLSRPDPGPSYFPLPNPASVQQPPAYSLYSLLCLVSFERCVLLCILCFVPAYTRVSPPLITDLFMRVTQCSA